MLKGLILASGILAFLPIGRLSAFLLERKNIIVSYPRMKIANTNDLEAGESLLFTYPRADRPAVLIHLRSGDFVGYDAVCPHLGCQVHFDEEPIKGWGSRKDNLFCSCHGAVFSPSDGSVLEGPPLRSLPKIRIDIDENGDIYADGYESGLPLFGEE